MNIAEKLVKLRKEKGLTQDKLAQELDISIASIKNYENIKKPREPKNDILLKFANFYDVSTEYLLNDNIVNKTTDNITIENKLNLSDNTIEKIVKINSQVNANILNSFINYMPISTFWEKINTYIEKKKQIEILIPLKQSSKKINTILKKYTTTDAFNNYYVTDNDGYILNIKSFIKDHNCVYNKEEKQLILEYLEGLKNNQCLDYKYGYIDNMYEISIDTIEELINYNSSLPIHYEKIILSIPQSEIDQRSYEMEIIEFQLSHELTNFLKSL